MTLTRGAQITGAALCAVLAAIEGGWLVRDLSAARSSLDLWNFWTGQLRTLSLTTTLEDLLLLLVYLTVLASAVRHRVTAGALVAAGLVTIAVRLPGLWVLTSSWMDLRATDELRIRAVYTAFGSLGLGVGLLITALAGARQPRRLPGRTPLLVSILLGAAAVVLAAWEIRTAALSPHDHYADRFTGSESALLPLLGIPPGWLTAVTVLLALVAALGGTRPIGLVGGMLVLAAGIRGAGTGLRNQWMGRLDQSSVEDKLIVLSWGFEAAAGAMVLVLLVGHKPQAALAPTEPQALGPPPPSCRPPGW
ncbi:hypothetical protein [Streptomyces albipurpureus]|uniref:Uncharacterized protein n=1 Tax=Streptomyces albipurpureus TaxID=2897419 RepID=A0ABT0UKX9_9ACTN|nr:hypothetical protein [Streptomyces sp. CWNU-1]MCM2389099.1 hypothetical protein [Streptomyces sp. CWNU-1]